MTQSKFNYNRREALEYAKEARRKLTKAINAPTTDAIYGTINKAWFDLFNARLELRNEKEKRPDMKAIREVMGLK